MTGCDITVEPLICITLWGNELISWSAARFGRPTNKRELPLAPSFAWSGAQKWHREGGNVGK